MKKYILILLLIGSIVIIAYGYIKSRDQQASLPLVSVTQGEISEKAIAIGTLTPLQKTLVKSPISGRVARLFFDAGDPIMKNQPLLEIQPDPTPEDYIKAKQTLEIDRAKERQYTADVKRYRQLLKAGVISHNDQTYSEAISNYQQAHQQRILDQETLSLLEKGQATIGNKTIANIITSPITGEILTRTINLGDPVVAQTSAQPGNTLYTIADMHSLIFKGQVSEIDVAKLHLNMPVELKIAALPDASLIGTLTKIALESTAASKDTSADNINTGSSANTSSQNNNLPFAVGFDVEVSHLDLHPKNLLLRAGYSATAEITVRQAKNTLLIPMRVLHFDENNNPYVLIEKKEKSPQKQFIKIGLSDGVQAQVLEGLRFGQKILDRSSQASNDGNE